MAKRHEKIVNVDEVDAQSLVHGERFAVTDRRLAFAAGARSLGCSHYELPPGKVAFPFHYHCANEEAIFVLEGEGTMRIGSDRVAVRAGDYIALPPGPEGAHQLMNSGAATLKYLCLSTMIPVEVVGYPDSKKHAASAASSIDAAQRGDRWVRHLWLDGPTAGYYDGEPE